MGIVISSWINLIMNFIDRVIIGLSMLWEIIVWFNIMYEEN